MIRFFVQATKTIVRCIVFCRKCAIIRFILKKKRMENSWKNRAIDEFSIIVASLSPFSIAPVDRSPFQPIVVYARRFSPKKEKLCFTSGFPMHITDLKIPFIVRFFVSIAHALRLKFFFCSVFWSCCCFRLFCSIELNGFDFILSAKSDKT